MKCVINIAMAVMLLAGFQQASADVCKLKVNADVKKALEKHDEVWVDKDNGKIYEGSFDGGVHIISVNKISTAFNDDCGLKDECRDAIFCNENGEVVINLPTQQQTKDAVRKFEEGLGEVLDDGHLRTVRWASERVQMLEKRNRTSIAKRQFENIIKCWLIVPVCQCKANGDLIGENYKQGTFNPRIFDTQFTVLQNGNWVCNEKWRMPGISADISDLTARNIPVVCAMKMDMESYISQMTEEDKQIYRQLLINSAPQNKKLTLNRKTFNSILEYPDIFNIPLYGQLNGEDALNLLLCNDMILNLDGWRRIFSGRYINFLVHNVEHTERQLMLYHMFDNTSEEWCVGNQWIRGQKRNDFRNVLIYTDGAPCFEEGGGKMLDNGGTCCWNIYREIPANISIDVYFSSLNTAIPARNIHVREAIFGEVANDNQTTFTQDMIDQLIGVNTRKNAFIHLMQMSDWHNNHQNITFTWL